MGITAREASEDVLMDAAKRYRVDVEKVKKTVAAEFAARLSEKSQPKRKAQNQATASG